MVIDKEIVLDQSFTPETTLSCRFTDMTAFVAQTYKAGITGTLIGVKLHILSNASLSHSTVYRVYPLRVAIRQVENGYPNTVTLGEVIVSDGEAPSNRLISFSEPIRQEAGMPYAIVVNYVGASSSSDREWLGNWFGATDDHYPDGELFYGPEGETWYASSVKDHDVQFQTFVVPD